MSSDIKDELFRLNAKIDHIMKVVCELFIMLKSNEQHDTKLDQCIKLLNNINYKVNNDNTSSISLPPPPPPPPPPLPMLSLSNYNTNNSSNNRNELIEELKERLKNIRID